MYRLIKASEVKSKEHVKNTSGKKRKLKGDNASVEAGNIVNGDSHVVCSFIIILLIINGP